MKLVSLSVLVHSNSEVECACVCVCTCVHMCMHVCTHVRASCVCACTCMYVCTHVCESCVCVLCKAISTHFHSMFNHLTTDEKCTCQTLTVRDMNLDRVVESLFGSSLQCYTFPCQWSGIETCCKKRHDSYAKKYSNETACMRNTSS